MQDDHMMAQAERQEPSEDVATLDRELPTVGRIVHVNIAIYGQPAIWRPALVLDDKGLAQLFLLPSETPPPGVEARPGTGGTWVKQLESVDEYWHDDEDGTLDPRTGAWCWPYRVGPVLAPLIQTVELAELEPTEEFIGLVTERVTARLLEQNEPAA